MNIPEFFLANEYLNLKTDEAGFYPRIPRLYILHPVGSGWLVFVDPDPHSSRRSMWVPETAYTSSGGLSQVAAVVYVLYSLASRLGLFLRQMRIQRTDPHQLLQKGLLPRWPSLFYVASGGWYRTSILALASPAFYSLASILQPLRSRISAIFYGYGYFRKVRYRIDFFCSELLLGPPRPSGLGGQLQHQRCWAMASPVLYCLSGCRNPRLYRGSRRFSSKVPTVPVRSGTICYRSLASGSAEPASPLEASEAAFYIRGAAPWPRLSSTAKSAVEIRASTADPGVFLQQYLHYAPVLYIPQPLLDSTDLATPPAAPKAASTMASHCGILASHSCMVFYTRRGLGGRSSLRIQRFAFTPGEFFIPVGSNFLI